jgi:hypothetical protein
MSIDPKHSALDREEREEPPANPEPTIAATVGSAGGITAATGVGASIVASVGAASDVGSAAAGVGASPEPREKSEVEGIASPPPQHQPGPETLSWQGPDQTGEQIRGMYEERRRRYLAAMAPGVTEPPWVDRATTAAPTTASVPPMQRCFTLSPVRDHATH